MHKRKNGIESWQRVSSEPRGLPRTASDSLRLLRQLCKDTCHRKYVARERCKSAEVKSSERASEDSSRIVPRLSMSSKVILTSVRISPSKFLSSTFSSLTHPSAPYTNYCSVTRTTKARGSIHQEIHPKHRGPRRCRRTLRTLEGHKSKEQNRR